jgi:nitrate/TMAO reductase-like tetraheme cytochrome c subunit
MGLCSKCHTDEGAKLYKDISGGHDELVDKLGSKPPVEDATVVQCRTCHNPHNPHELLFSDLRDGEDNVLQSAEYRTCTNCHQALGSFGLADGFHGENNGHSWSGGPPAFPVGVPPFNPAEIIYDTHFDNKDTPGIEGYNLGPVSNESFGLASERTCRDCHNVHAADTTINKQWARSGHGGHIAEVKEAADDSDPQNILDAAVGGADGSQSAFTVFNFATFAGGSCSRCHTTSGAKNYLDDPENYSPRNNNFSHLSGAQKELMYCWGCHADNSGGLRDPGPITAAYTSVSFTFPDLMGSNVCTACHTGRESGEVISNSDDDFSDKGFVDSHYLSAGGTLFNATGYEFAGRDYSNSIYFIHDRVGLTNPLQPGDNGPCIGCHMKTEEGHLFASVAKDITGQIVELTSFEQTCSNCHTGPEELLAVVNELEEGFTAALESLRIELAKNDFYFLGGFPYFSDTDWTSAKDPSGKNNMGAAFNYNLLHHEPGAYTHNLQYARKLLYDSIDFLDDGILNTSVETTLGSGKAFNFLAGTRQ